MKRVVVWDGEEANSGAGWVNPTNSTIRPQSIEAHGGKTALEFKFHSTNQWIGAGWNWFKFKTGTNVGTDASAIKNLSFWIKSKGRTGDLQVNLLCNGDVLDTPEEHTVKVQVLKYCPRLLDGGWHEVVIPMADLNQIKGFNPKIISEIHFGFTPEKDADGSFFIDDIAFDNGSIDRSMAAAPDEMLVNGNFAGGLTNWVVEQTMGATGQVECVNEGPDGKAALRFKVLSIADAPWHLQFYQTGLRVRKGKTYVLTFWAKSNQDGNFMVNCQQNHAPWEHPTKKEMSISPEWRQMQYTFVAAWDDDNVRITFTNLGNTPNQVYWFANCSLVPTPEAKTSAASAPATAGPVITLNQPIGPYSSPVKAHGALQVVGAHVCDASGKPYQLKGMSLYWSHWSGQYYTKATINALAEDWRCSVVRAATGAEPGEGGYLDNPTAAVARVKTVVDAAIAKGIYVIIDWHKEHAVWAPSQVTQATAFFTQMATTYGSYPNVIFEIYNEPNGPKWPAIKAYAETVIGAIRKTGSTNLVVVGTPIWSQDVDIAALDPITDFTNVAYTLHFYAGSHKQFLRDKATKAMSKGIALFVTEWGTCDSSGNGGLDLAESSTWLDFLNQNSISWVNFSLHDKAETASALKPGTLVTGPPSASDLTPSGVFVYNKLVAP